jgi:signal transduction histidine kinase/CheY-like chemotaxis protein
VALERARTLAPFVLLAMVGSAALSDRAGIPLTTAVIVYNAVAIPGIALMSWALLRRKVPDRWSHAMMTIAWWAPVGATLMSHYASDSPQLNQVLLVEIACTTILLDTRSVIASLVAVDLIWVPLIVRAGGDQAWNYISAAAVAEVFAVLIQILLRRSLVRSELNRIAAAETSAKLEVQLAEVARSHEERTRLQEQLLHAQRLESLGTLAAGLAHDMNNVLGSITGLAGLLLDEPRDPETGADLERIISQAERGASLTRGLLAFSRRGKYRKLVVPLEQVVRDVLPLLARTLPKSIEVRSELAAPDACVEGDPSQLAQVLVNFAVNAADAMSGKGTLSITADVCDLDGEAAIAAGLAPGRHGRLQVSDTGTGMDEATRRRVFEPFFTTKPMGRGTGLGLSTVWGVVKTHGGAVSCDSEPGRGTTFSVLLPLSAEAAPAPVPRPPTDPLRARGTVLVVDDEPLVRLSTSRMLERMGLSVLEAGNGAEGLEVFREHDGAIALVVLDMGMPVMGGAECFRELRTHSQVPVLVATGYAVDEDVQALVAAGAGLLEKPFRMADLTREVTRLLDGDRADGGTAAVPAEAER